MVCVVLASAAVTEGGPSVGVIPSPQVTRPGSGTVVLARAGGTVPVAFLGAGPAEGRSLDLGRTLLGRRLNALGAADVDSKAGEGGLTVSLVDAGELRKRLVECVGNAVPDDKRLEQAYLLHAAEGGVDLSASRPLGAYYGLVSLCQLLHGGPDGDIVVPAVTIADWPAVRLRLAKTSASRNAPETIAEFAAWLPVMKMNLIGLQFHGQNSKDPGGHFPKNVRTHCPRFREEGLLESIVYFCPFRDQGTNQDAPRQRAYNFSQNEDRRAYAEYLRWIMAQGAHGIEVDYNDWPGSRQVPIADVLNLACDALEEKHPNAYVLYCPPNRGKQTYRGMATESLGETLRQAPKKVWPLWTGMHTLITRPLQAEQAGQWTRIAGRRPFLWVNRVSLGVDRHFARKVPEADGAYVFRGEYLPQDLHRLFEGVHFNAGMSQGYNTLGGEFRPAAVAYLATAADYVWNPEGWDAAESCRRSRRFVQLIAPLLRAAQGESGAPAWRN